MYNSELVPIRGYFDHRMRFYCLLHPLIWSLILCGMCELLLTPRPDTWCLLLYLDTLDHRRHHSLKAPALVGLVLVLRQRHPLP